MADAPRKRKVCIGSDCQCRYGDQWYDAHMVSHVGTDGDSDYFRIHFKGEHARYDGDYARADLRPMPVGDEEPAEVPAAKRVRTDAAAEPTEPAAATSAPIEIDEPAAAAPAAPSIKEKAATPEPAAAAPGPPAEAGGQTSRFRGVHWDAYNGKWQATIHLQGHRIPLGDFDVEEDAARAYDAARTQWQALMKYKTPINFPDEAPLESALAALPPLPWQIDPAPLRQRRRRLQLPGQRRQRGERRLERRLAGEVELSASRR